MYLRDMNNTKYVVAPPSLSPGTQHTHHAPFARTQRGHIAALTGCAWHPTDRETYLTSSEDFTIR